MNILITLLILAGASVYTLPVNTINVKNTEARTPAPIVREKMHPKDYLYAIASRSAKVCGYSKAPKCRTVNIAEQLDEIITRESKWGYDGTDHAVCNKEYGCGSGKGLIQLIERTRGHCSEKLKKEIDKSNPYDSIECGIYLLEEEGIQHWDDNDVGKPGHIKWGSGPY